MVPDIPNLRVHTPTWLKLQRWLGFVARPKITPREAAVIAIALEASEPHATEEKLFHLKYPLPEVLVLEKRNSYSISCGYVDLGILTEIDNQTGEVIQHSLVGRV